MKRLICGVAAFVLGLGLGGGWVARADEAEPPPNAFADSCAQPSLFDPEGKLRGRVLPGWLKLCGTLTSDAYVNLRGGLRRGASYNGHVVVNAAIDLRQFGWDGASVFASASHSHGRGPSAGLVGNLQTVSNVEETDSTRLVELWIDQSFLDDAVSVRFGQMAADQEFNVYSPAVLPLVNSAFGYPIMPSFALPNGGPVAPLAAPGVRLKLRGPDELAVLVGLYNGDPVGPGAGGIPRQNPDGLALRTGDGATILAELQFRAGVFDGETKFKIGGFYNNRRFADQRIDTTGISLAASTSAGTPAQRRGDLGIYGQFEHTLIQGAAGEPTLTLFGRIAKGRGDRNVFDLSIDGGLSLTAPFSRPDDAVAIAVGYGRIGRNAVQFDRDMARLQPGMPVRDHETVLELSYQYQVVPGLVVQPDAQVILHPGGGAGSPTNHMRRIGDAALVGVRTLLQF